jgi:hypothetical protein
MRQKFLLLLLGFGVFILVSTELLNIFHAINNFWITLLWITALITAGLIFKKELSQTVNIPHIFQKLSLTEKILSVGILIYLGILLLIATVVVILFMRFISGTLQNVMASLSALLFLYTATKLFIFKKPSHLS